LPTPPGPEGSNGTQNLSMLSDHPVFSIVPKCHSRAGGNPESPWIPAFAGMTNQQIIVAPSLKLFCRE
jgi:hypothetical protein